MRYYSHDKFWKRIFLFPDTGGNATTGSSTGNPAASQGGGQQQQDSSTGFTDPTAGLDLDDLEPGVREVIEKSRAGFATLQKTAADAKAAAAAEEQRRKDFQSSYDKLRTQVEGTLGKKSGDADPKEAAFDKMVKTLTSKGVPEPQAKVQAEIMMELLGDFGNELKNQIGKDLQPFASTIVSREAEFAWQQAVAKDNTGALQDPELAQEVWDKVQLMAQNGQQVDLAIVQNLTGMAYFARLQAGKIAPGGNNQQTVNQQQQLLQLPNVGRLTYPGAGAQPSRPPTFDPNGARTVLDSATDAALQAVMGTWAKGQGGVKAPGYREPAKKGGR